MAIIKWEKPNRRGSLGKMMQIDEVSINFVPKGSSTLTFNQFLNEEIDRRGLVYLNIQQEDTTGEIYLVLNQNDGVTLSKTGGYKKDTRGRNSYNYKISSRDWIVRLMNELKIPIEKGRTVLKITANLSKKEECMTFRIRPIQ